MIDLYIDDFVYGHLASYNGDTLSVPYAPVDVVRGAISVFRPSPPAMLLRTAMDLGATALQILSVLDDGLTGPLGLSATGPTCAAQILAALDGTEKGNASYRVGMGMANLLCQDWLGVAAAGHFDRLLEAGLATLASGRSRPDLVGIDVFGNWTVAEAKGRSNGVTIDDIEHAKGQVENVDDVGNSATTTAPPLWRIASLTDLSTKPIRVTFVDPPNSDEESVPDPTESDSKAKSHEPTKIVVNPLSLTRGYYRIVDQTAQFTGGIQRLPGVDPSLEARGARLPGTRVWIGLAQQIRSALEGSDDGLFARLDAARIELANRSVELPSEGGGDRFTSVGRDGFVVYLEL
jgi:hypothetical protein